MYKLTQKTLDILDLIWYDLDRVFNDSSNLWWTIGKSRKFVALGMSKQEALEKGFLTIHPLYGLCEKNDIIPVEWIEKYLDPMQYLDWMEKSRGSTRSELGIYSRDVRKYLELSWL